MTEWPKTTACFTCGGEGIGDWGSCLQCGGKGTIEVLPAPLADALCEKAEAVLGDTTYAILNEPYHALRTAVQAYREGRA